MFPNPRFQRRSNAEQISANVFGFDSGQCRLTQNIIFVPIFHDGSKKRGIADFAEKNRLGGIEDVVSHNERLAVLLIGDSGRSVVL